MLFATHSSRAIIRNIAVLFLVHAVSAEIEEVHVWKMSYGKYIADKLASCSLTFNGEEGAKICFIDNLLEENLSKL